ncbi:methionine import ATP-binding protein MetN [Acetobacter cibinongensis]|uniref:ABC transporter D-methionine transport MetN n=1 Tax=Acetobacter cibinongensis TaxID=146475 RepID=A0A0D6N178_9PROT|nr:ABC transporter D-methionine transport MetN [Acetobacter cibinongensis]GBQ12529.1 D-methionine transporter ATP-binding protein [Acetobacter cibinongensis NRIC 0482]GEL59475.1 methionine import ATP-binding protein MetN [Acetobacter cibinongensis]
MERPDSGRILFEGEDLAAVPDNRLVMLRRKIGFVFQHFNLLSSRTVASNIALPLEITGAPAPQRKKRVAELLDLVGLSDHASKYPALLSGGQKQRVGIARALAANPALLLCDEATSALDPETTSSILKLLSDINHNLGLTLVFITHEMDVVRQLGRHVVVLEHGRIIARGTPDSVLQNDPPLRLPSGLSPTARAGDHTVLRLTLDTQALIAPLLADSAAQATVLDAQARQTGGTQTLEALVQLSTSTPDALSLLQATAQSVEVIGYVPSDT